MGLQTVLENTNIVGFNSGDKTKLVDALTDLYNTSPTARSVLDKIWFFNQLTIKHQVGVFQYNPNSNEVQLDLSVLDAFQFYDQHGVLHYATLEDVLIHEIIHALDGVHDPSLTTLDAANPDFYGPTVDKTNLVMEELNYGYIRAGYFGSIATPAPSWLVNATEGNSIDFAYVDHLDDNGVSHALNRSQDTLNLNNLLITTGDHDDFIRAGAGRDYVYSGGGRDLVEGGAGNDFIDGGDGADKAIFAMDSGFYQVKRFGDRVVVTSKFAVMTDGVDTLRGVEFIQFHDKTISVFNNPDLPDLSAGTASGGNATDGGLSPSSGPSGNEQSSPGNTANTINGTDASEYLSGTSGPDAIHGNGGDDVLTGYGGQDTFDGGPGSDTVDYSYEPASVPGTVDLAAGTATFPSFYTEQLTSIENVWMGAGDDTVYGSDGDNDLRGGPGDDVLRGGLGNDTVYGDWKYSDEGGSDTAVLSYIFASGYTVSGNVNTVHIVGAEGDDWYYNVEHFKFADGLNRTTQELFELNSYNAAGHSLRRVSVTSNGSETDRHSEAGSISADGRYIVFASDAGNLVPGDTNDTTDIFVFDRLTALTERVSVASDSSQANGSSDLWGHGEISADGRYVVFSSSASNLVSGDFNVCSDVFVHDRATGLTERISGFSQVTQNSYDSGHAEISADGQFVVFSARSLFRFGYEVFLYDRETNVTEIVSPSHSGIADTWYPSISGDGNVVAFLSGSSDLVGGDTNGVWDTFVFDRASGITERISVGGSDIQANARSVSSVVLSYDGRFVAFDSLASNLVENDMNGACDVFVYDRVLRSVERVSVDSTGVEGNGNSGGFFSLGISADGRYVSYYSDATNLVAGDTAGRDVFVRDRLMQTTARVSISEDGTQLNGLPAEGSSMSGDGRFVVFSSNASSLVPNDTNGKFDVFLVDRAVINRDPVARSDDVETDAATVVSGNIFINNGNGIDGDVDGDLLTVVAVNGITGDVARGVALPSGARVVVNHDGRFVYDPNGSFDDLGVGEAVVDSFTYTITDGQGHSSTTAVNVTIAGILHGLEITNGSGIINGTLVDDQIAGGPGIEIIRGRSGYDWLQGMGGADTLFGDDGSDVLDGGPDVDVLTGGPGSDIYIVDNANDVVAENPNEGTDTIQTALGNFNLGLIANVENLTFTDSGPHTGSGNELNNMLTGGSGNDTFFAGAGADTLNGGDGNDFLQGNALGADAFSVALDTFNGGDGDDTLQGVKAGDVIQGGAGHDLLYLVNSNPITINLGTTGIEYIETLFGNDVIDGSTQSVGIEVYSDGGNDTITGSASNDILWPGSGNNTVNGGDGDDVIVGDIGADSLSGGNGNDSLYVDASDTLIDGGADFDAAYITGGSGMSINMATAHLEWAADFVGGNDTIDGSGVSANMEVYAAGGTDNITGGSGADFLWGGSGNDTIVGNGNNDTLVGEAGADTLTGGAGTDTLFGSTGGGDDGALDTFVFGDGWGTDFVFDFVHGVDKIDMTAVSGLNDFSQLTLTNTVDGHCYVSFAGNLIAVANMAGQLTASDFLL